MAVKSFLEKTAGTNLPFATTTQQHTRREAAEMSQHAQTAAEGMARRAVELHHADGGDYARFRGKALPPLRRDKLADPTNNTAYNSSEGLAVLNELAFPITE